MADLLKVYENNKEFAEKEQMLLRILSGVIL